MDKPRRMGDESYRILLRAHLWPRGVYNIVIPKGNSQRAKEAHGEASTAWVLQMEGLVTVEDKYGSTRSSHRVRLTDLGRQVYEQETVRRGVEEDTLCPTCHSKKEPGFRCRFCAEIADEVRSVRDILKGRPNKPWSLVMAERVMGKKG